MDLGRGRAADDEVKITITLPADRRVPGRLDVTMDDGTFLLGTPARGKSDQLFADARGNPTRDPKLPGGDFPCGSYRADPPQFNKPPARSYGPCFVPLEAVSGDAYVREDAEPGADGIGIHGGDLNADKTLRSTHGCLRIPNWAAEELGRLIQAERDAGQEINVECKEEA